MKNIVLVLGLVLLSTPVFAQSAVANWDPVTLDVLGGPETIAYYTLYYGTTSRPGTVIHPSDGAFAYDTLMDVGNVTQYQVDNLTNGVTYYFAVAAVDVGGNVSDYSAEVPYNVPTEDCNNLLDDDHDGLTDCQDVECSAQTEVCDGFDNDCDGTPDNNMTAPLCTEQDGVCAASTQSCGGAAGWQACDASSYGNDYEANEASCDGLDNDCDTQTDEDLTAPPCDLQVGVCNGSTKRCGGGGGWLDCDGSDYGGNYEATETTCDGLDNDCDNQTDEDCPCTPNDTQPCGTGKCAGTQTCEAGGNWGACDGPAPDPAESCNNIDDDCDGTTDEDLAAPDCALQAGVCSGSVQTCAGASGWQACDAASYGNDYEADEASCDGLDNDCDDSTDEDLTGPACPLQQGVCQGSTQACGGAGGWEACDASSYGNDYEETEISCDSLDNDCDGTTDDDCPCTPGAQQTCSSNEGECVEGNQTCDANGSWGACDGTLPREETCDGLDNDCDTQTDEDVTGLPCPLQDGVCAGVAATCGGTAGWVCDYGSTYEADTETLCDDLDNDCDGETDEDCGETVVEGSCGCAGETPRLAWLPLLLLLFIIRRR